MKATNYKRKTRKMSPATKAKISKKLLGRKHTDEHKKRISEGMKAAWSKIPNE